MFGSLKLNSCCIGASFAGIVTANFFNASFHLHCYRESSKAGPADSGGLHSSGVSFVRRFQSGQELKVLPGRLAEITASEGMTLGHALTKRFFNNTLISWPY